MADNIQITQGSGTTWGTDEIGGTHYQRTKLIHGADGVNDGDVSNSNPFPAKITDGTRSASIRDTGSSDSLNVAITDASGNQITSFGGGTEYTEGDTDSSITGKAMMMEGAANALVPAQGTVADGMLVNLGGNNDVTVTGSLTANAGTNLNTSALALETGGNLAAAATSLAIIDDWDESDRAKVNIIAGQAGVAGGSGTVSATTQRVCLATDVGLPAGSNAIGSVTANAGTNLNTSALALESGGNLAGTATSLAVIDDWDETDRCKVNPIAGQAGVAGGSGVVGSTTQRVVLATDVALPAGTNAIGTVTSVGTAADDAAVTGNPVTIGLEARRARRAAVSHEGDSIRAAGDRYGRTQIVGVDLLVATLDATSSGDTDLLAALGSGHRIKVYRVEASNTHASTALTAGLKSASLNSGAVFGKKYLPAAGGQAVWNFPGGHLMCGNNEALKVNLSSAGTVSFTVYYEDIDN